MSGSLFKLIWDALIRNLLADIRFMSVTILATKTNNALMSCSGLINGVDSAACREFVDACLADYDLDAGGRCFFDNK
ncbi:MAG: hypothetical protein R2865_17530 [Deinococcales bacterium]